MVAAILSKSQKLAAFRQLSSLLRYLSVDSSLMIREAALSMDEKDHLILTSLTKNARLSTATLGRSLGVSRATIQNRIDKLISTGVIRRFTVELGTTDVAMISALVLLRLSPGDSRPVIARLKKLQEIKSFSSLNGNYDFSLEIEAPSTKHLDDVLKEIRLISAVIETNCSIRLANYS